jgi:hypothetical protein
MVKVKAKSEFGTLPISILAFAITPGASQSNAVKLTSIIWTNNHFKETCFECLKPVSRALVTEKVGKAWIKQRNPFVYTNWCSTGLTGVSH